MNIHTSDFNSKYVVLKTGVQCDITGMHMKKKCLTPLRVPISRPRQRGGGYTMNTKFNETFEEKAREQADFQRSQGDHETQELT